MDVNSEILEQQQAKPAGNAIPQVTQVLQADLDAAAEATGAAVRQGEREAGYKQDREAGERSSGSTRVSDRCP